MLSPLLLGNSSRADLSAQVGCFSSGASSPELLSFFPSWSIGTPFLKMAQRYLVSVWCFPTDFVPSLPLSLQFRKRRNKEQRNLVILESLASPSWSLQLRFPGLFSFCFFVFFILCVCVREHVSLFPLQSITIESCIRQSSLITSLTKAETQTNWKLGYRHFCTLKTT